MPKKDYSADALIAEAKANAYQKSKEPQESSAPNGTPPPSPVPNQPDYVNAAFQQGQEAAVNQQFQLPAKKEDAVIPEEKWDYKTATTNPQGEALQTFKIGKWTLEPKGFDPNGDVYFGAGLKGWMQKFAYKAVMDGTDARYTEEQSQTKIKDSWDKIVNSFTGEGSAMDAVKSINPLLAVTDESNRQRMKDRASGLWGIISGMWDLGESTTKLGGVNSPLSPLLKSTRLLVEGGFDVLQGFADTAERVIGMSKTMREYADENGSRMPDLSIDYVAEPIRINEKYTIQTDFIDTFMRMALPAFQAYDTIRFWSAPGTFKEKTTALQNGWTENKMLYSELVSPAIEAEFKMRLKAGEDPALLTMELQDPWAELGGEMLLDPLNVFDFIGKGAKFAADIAGAQKAVGVADEMVEVVDHFNDIQNISTDAQASGLMDKIAQKTQSFFYDELGNAKKFGVQNYNASALNAAGNQSRMTRQLSNFMSFGISTIKQSGGKVDDILDWVGATVKLSSSNMDEVKEGLAVLQASKIPTLTNFSQGGMEASYFLRNIISDGDVESFIARLQKNGGDWSETVKTLDGVISEATHYAYPTVTEMAEAAAKLDPNALENAKSITSKINDLKAELKVAVEQKASQGAKRLEKQIAQLEKKVGMPSERTQKLAEQYAELKRTRPGLVRMAEFDRVVNKIRHPINSFFAGTYFSLSYGFAVRNHITNLFHLVTDAGIDSLFLSNKKVDDLLMSIGAGELPVSLRTGFGAADALPAASDGILKEAFAKLDAMPLSPKALAAKSEAWAGKRIFYKFYRDTMDTMLKPGVGLPRMEEWLAQGFSKQMVEDYTDLIKARGYNVTEATDMIKAKYGAGADMWRQLDTINPEVRKALSDNNSGAMDSIVNFLNDPKVKTKEQVTEFFENARREAIIKAKGIADDAIGVASSSPSAERIAEMAEKYGNDIPQHELTKMEALENAADNAKNNYLEALKQAEKKISLAAQDAARRGEDVTAMNAAADRIKKFAFSSAGTQMSEETAKSVKQLNRRWYEEIQGKIKKDGVLSNNANDYKAAWDTDFMGPMEIGDYGTWKNAFMSKGYESWVTKKEAFWDSHFQQWFGSADGIAESLGDEFADLFKDAKKKSVDLQAMRNNTWNNKGEMFHTPPAFTPVPVNALGSEANASNIAKIANNYGLGSIAGDINTGAGAKGDQKLLNIINDYIKKNAGDIKDVKGMDKANNALYYLKQNGGIDPKEFSDIFGGTFGKDKLGVMPGLIQKGGRNAIDEVGKRLVEGGFMTADEATDANNIREFIRTHITPTSYTDAGAASAEIQNLIDNGYRSLKDVPAETAEAAFQFRTGEKGNLAGRIPKTSQAAEIISDPAFQRIKEQAARLKRANASGDASNLVSEDSKKIADYLQSVNDETTKIQREFGKKNREARGTGIVPRLTYDKLSQAVQSLPNEALSFTLESITKKAETLGVTAPPELAKFFEDMGGSATRREILDFSAKLEMGLDTSVASKVQDVAQTAQDVAPLVPDKTRAYYDDAGNLIEPDTEGLVKAAPDYIDGSKPSAARAQAESLDGTLEALTHVQDEVLKRWGLKGDPLSQQQIDQMAKFGNGVADKVNEARYTAQLVGEKMRDFTLLPYGQTTNLDHAMSYIYPYQFWYSRTYKNWMKRLTTNSALLAGYGRLKDTMADVHKDMPDWWKHQVQIPDFLGINEGNPMFINLETAIWPLTGITGTDFNDPEKRTNWFTATLDDMGKFGPSIWTPINMAVAGYYANKGQKDIAAKWGSRLISQTATVKAISSYWGTPIELDPNVRIFSGDGIFDSHASDPYEEGRISRALAAMAAEGVPEQQLMEAARTHSGPLWDEAYQRAVNQRAPGQIASTLLGVGFKPRTEDDIQTDQFYSDYAMMRTKHENGMISDEQYAQGFNKLREQYPFMDVILLSRRAGMGRDAAYAYNVISRIPPGMTKDIYNIIGVDQATADKFYSSGGKLDGMSETEKMRFMAAMVDAGAMLAIPNTATRKEWTAAKNQYKYMQSQLQKQYGEDISDKISLYFGMDDKKAAKLFIDSHPEVAEALDAQTAYIANDPQLVKFYGGIDTIERFYTAQMYDKLEKQFGDEITTIEGGYFNIFDPKEKKAYLNQHPELKAYWDAKEIYKEENVRQLVTFGSKLQQPELQTTGNEPENPTQAELQQFANPEPAMSFDQWSQAIGEPMTEIIQDYWFNDKDLPTAAKKNLDYMAGEYGYEDGDAMLQAILQSMQ